MRRSGTERGGGTRPRHQKPRPRATVFPVYSLERFHQNNPNRQHYFQIGVGIRGERLPFTLAADPYFVWLDPGQPLWCLQHLILSMRTIGNEVNDGRLRRFPSRWRRSGIDGCQPGCCTFVLHRFKLRPCQLACDRLLRRSFQAGVNLHVPRSEAVRDVRG